MFWVGLGIGLVIGGTIGILVHAFITANEIDD
jgi:hypothetical protein